MSTHTRRLLSELYRIEQEMSDLKKDKLIASVFSYIVLTLGFAEMFVTIALFVHGPVLGAVISLVLTGVIWCLFFDAVLRDLKHATWKLKKNKVRMNEIQTELEKEFN